MCRVAVWKTACKVCPNEPAKSGKYSVAGNNLQKERTKLMRVVIHVNVNENLSQVLSNI